MVSYRTQALPQVEHGRRVLPQVEHTLQGQDIYLPAQAGGNQVAGENSQVVLALQLHRDCAEDILVAEVDIRVAGHIRVVEDGVHIPVVGVDIPVVGVHSPVVEDILVVVVEVHIPVVGDIPVVVVEVRSLVVGVDILVAGADILVVEVDILARRAEAPMEGRTST